MNEKITTIKNKVIISESEGYMNELKIFQNSEFGTIRTLSINNEPWFVGKDVASILGYAKPENAIANHVYEEDKTSTLIQGSGSNYKSKAIIINESGLYSLILSSKLPRAKEFKRWVTSEVLPSIRKHGAYMTEETLQRAITSPDFLIKLATELKREQNARKLAEQQVKELTPKGIFADAVKASDTSILVGELAKLLKQNGVNIGRNRLFDWMKDNGYLIKKGMERNMPTQKSMEMKLLEIKERNISNPDGSIKIVKTPKVTGKGQIYFINKLLKAKEG